MAEQLVQEWLEVGSMGDQFLDEAKVTRDIIGSLELGTLTFPDFIHCLTSRLELEQDLTVAARVLGLLAQVLRNIQVEPSRNDVHALVPYLCARLENASAGLKDVAESLHTLSTWKRFPPGDAQAVATAVFKFGSSNNFASQTAVTRLALYELVDVLFKAHPATLKRDLSVQELVKGLVTMAELEKNPSCLRALFKLYAHISEKWELSAEEFKLMFDSFVRYFPVSMKDAPMDPSIPTTEELRELLLRCFVSNDGYATMTFEAMVDRLDVDSANTKVEVFKTIEEGVKSYSIPTVSLAAPKLWDSLKFEVWNGENEDFIQPSLNVLKQMASSLDKSRWEWLENDNPVNTFVIAALAECKQRIQDKQSTYLGPCGRIFNAIASASPHAFYLVVRFMLPVLDTLWQAHTGGPEKVLVLGVLNGILRARLVQVDVVPLPEAEFAALSPEMQEYQHMSESHMTNGFNEFRDRIIEMYHEDVTRVMENTELSEKTDSYGVPAIQGLVLIFSIPYYLSDAEKGMMAGELVEITLKRDQIGDIQAESLSALGQISGMEPNLFQKIVLPAIMDKLPEKLSSEPEQQELELSSAISYLEDLVQIVSTSSSSSSTASYRQHNFTAMQEKIVEKLGETMLHKGQLRFQHALLAAASAWFESSKGDDTRPAGGPLRDLQRFREEGQFGGPILQLFQKVVQPKEHISDPVLGYTGLADVGDNLDDKFIQLVGEYAMRALRDDSTTEENNFLTTWDRSHPDEPSAIWTLFTKNTRPDSLASSQPNLLSAPADKCLANALSMYLIAGTRREDIRLIKNKINIGNTAAAMMQNAVAVNVNCSKFARLSILWFLQLLVNKFGATKEPVASSGHSLVDLMREFVELAPLKSKEEANNTYQTLAYFAAASLGNLDPSTTSLVQLMLDGIVNPKYGRKIAQSFRILIAPSEILTKENFCHLRPLRKGRLHELAVKPLVELWRNSQDKAIKDNCLIALAGILTYFEPTMISDYAKELLPVLLEGTNIQGDDFVKGACINGILKVIPLAPQTIEEHLKSVIDRMTDRTHNTYNSPSDSNVRCRAMALEVLLVLTEHVKPGLLFRKKSALMSELDIALEDCSREVRHKAEQCKMAWFNLAETE